MYVLFRFLRVDVVLLLYYFSNKCCNVTTSIRTYSELIPPALPLCFNYWARRLCKNEYEGVLYIYIKLAFQMSIIDYSKRRNRPINLRDLYLLSSGIYTYRHTKRNRRFGLKRNNKTIVCSNGFLLLSHVIYLTDQEGQIDHYQSVVDIILVIISDE